jgi:hypothetical protein
VGDVAAPLRLTFSASLEIVLSFPKENGRFISGTSCFAFCRCHVAQRRKPVLAHVKHCDVFKYALFRQHPGVVTFVINEFAFQYANKGAIKAFRRGIAQTFPSTTQTATYMVARQPLMLIA